VANLAAKAMGLKRSEQYNSDRTLHRRAGNAKHVHLPNQWVAPARLMPQPPPPTVVYKGPVITCEVWEKKLSRDAVVSQGGFACNLCGLWRPYDFVCELTTVPPQPTGQNTGIVPFSGFGWNINAPAFVPDAIAVNGEVNATPYVVVSAKLDSNLELDSGANANVSTAVSNQRTAMVAIPSPTDSVLSICIDRMWDLDVVVAGHRPNAVDGTQRSLNECKQQVDNNLKKGGGAVKYDCNQQ